jgi:hypothetical protein
MWPGSRGSHEMVRMRQAELRREADEYRRAVPTMRRRSATGSGLRVLVGWGLVRVGMRILDAGRA